jgi:Rieske 2Fe-2S family protein
MLGHVDESRPRLEPTLPSRFYTNAAIFQQERERIFFREWFCAGREEEIPKPGDYLQLDIAGESVLLVRTRQGQLRAFYNICRHRGCRLAPGEAGKPARADEPGATGTFPGVIRCTYHSWTYELTGGLRSAPFVNDQIDKAEYGLYPVGVATWGGFVFVNLTPEEAEAAGHTLEAQIGGAIEYARNYPLADLRIGKRIVYDVQANWKVILENANECYHCGGVHPELCEVVPAFKAHGGDELDLENGIPHREGAFTFTWTGTTKRRPFPGLNEYEQVRHKAYLMFPNVHLSFSPEHVAVFNFWPQSVERTRIVFDWLFHTDEIARPDFDPSDTVSFWDTVNRQDWAICEEVQRGSTSRRFERGFSAPQEGGEHSVRAYVSQKLEVEASV